MEVQDDRGRYYTVALPVEYRPALQVSWDMKHSRLHATLSMERTDAEDDEGCGKWMIETAQVVIDRINHYLAEKKIVDADTVEMVAKHWVYAQQLINEETESHTKALKRRGSDFFFRPEDTPRGTFTFKKDEGSNSPAELAWPTKWSISRMLGRNYFRFYRQNLYESQSLL